MVQMRVTFHTRKHQEVIRLNPDHTVDDLYALVRQRSPDLPAPGAVFQLSTGFPPKPLLVGLQTLAEARVDRASLQQTLL